MKVKDLAKILEGMNPESDITFTLGKDDEYRETCSKVQLLEGECLDYLDVVKVQYFPENNNNPSWADIVLEQYNWIDLDKKAEDFDIIYKLK